MSVSKPTKLFNSKFLAIFELLPVSNYLPLNENIVNLKESISEVALIVSLEFFRKSVSLHVPHRDESF